MTQLARRPALEPAQRKEPDIVPLGQLKVRTNLSQLRFHEELGSVHFERERLVTGTLTVPPCGAVESHHDRRRSSPLAFLRVAIRLVPRFSAGPMLDRLQSVARSSPRLDLRLRRASRHDQVGTVRRRGERAQDLGGEVRGAEVDGVQRLTPGGSAGR